MNQEQVVGVADTLADKTYTEASDAAKTVAAATVYDDTTTQVTVEEDKTAATTVAEYGCNRLPAKCGCRNCDEASI